MGLMTFLRAGKVKDIYDAGGERLLMVFTDRLSSHDVMLSDEVPGKGEVLCRLSAHCFRNCEAMGLETHMLGLADTNKMLVRRLEIVPIEVIVRNHLYGSYWKRFQGGLVELPKGTPQEIAAKLSKPIVEFTTKFEAKDRPVSEKEILEAGWLSERELDEVVEKTLEVNRLICKDADCAGFILADFKLEFGRERDGRLILADEAETPDACRFWDAISYAPGRVQESFDKQIVRDYLERFMGWDKNQPTPGSKLERPILPAAVVEKTIARYIDAFERLTGLPF